jgi:prepilin-type N-terminal cleavage/methylation domain-containing protein
MNQRGARAGFSLLEMTIAIGILGVALGGIGMIVRTSGEAFSAGSARMVLEGKGNRSLARVTELLRSAERATLAPSLSPPASAPTIDFRDCLGPEVGGVTFGEIQRIRLAPAQDAVEWVEDLGLAGERTLVICRGVPDLLEGELLNNLDDNGNGLVDEPGLCFAFEDGALTIRLTLESNLPGGRSLSRTFEGRVFCRN